MPRKLELVIGIDPSLTNTAVCLGNRDRHKMKCFPSKPQGKDVAGRIYRAKSLALSIRKWILKQALSQKVGVGHIFIEGYSFASKGQAILNIAEFGGILRSELLVFGSNIHEIAPTTLKKFITGKGNTKKEQMIAHVMNRWGVMFDTNDEADAMGLFQLGLAYVEQVKVKSFQRQIISKLQANKEN